MQKTQTVSDSPRSQLIKLNKITIIDTKMSKPKSDKTDDDKIKNSFGMKSSSN